MNNTFLPTGITVTDTFATLASYLLDAGFPDIEQAPVTSDEGVIRNNSSSINVHIGFGATAPTDYAILGPLCVLETIAGLNTSLVWIRSASSTAQVDFIVGGASYQPPVIGGVIGTITVTENTLTKGNASGDLVDSLVTDDGTTVEAGGDFTVTGAAVLEGTLDVTGVVTTTAATNLGATIAPTTNDVGALGDATHSFADLFLASGAVVNYANGNVAITHTSGILTMGTGEMRITTVGTNTASVVTVGGAQTLTNKGLTAPTINGGAVLGATSTEIDQLNDVTAYQESVVAAGALSVTKVYSGLAVVGGGAVTLAAPSATMLGQIKTIEMTTDDGDVTLSLAEVVGGTAATTCTFDTALGSLVLLALSTKWVVIKQYNVTLT